jgi:hypothetical protein
MSSPLALYQGPAPIRSRAEMPRLPSAYVLKYLGYVWPLLPAAVAKAAQCASAPFSPPRLAPEPSPELVMKEAQWRAFSVYWHHPGGQEKRTTHHRCENFHGVKYPH